MTTITFTLLGTGSSGGVPRIDGNWGDCDPNEPRNYRTRCCAIVEKADGGGNVTRVLIDTSPDLRTQILREKIPTIDALVFTHEHADQVHGIDDVRAFVINRQRPIPTYMNHETREVLSNRFRYCFQGAGGYPPILDIQETLRPGKPISIDGYGGPIELVPLELVHGRIKCLGFRIGNLAYCNDVNDIPAETIQKLSSLDTLIIDALRRTPHPSHAHLDQALEWIEQLKPQKAILTNLHVDMDYQTLMDELPSHIVPAFDGMKLVIS